MAISNQPIPLATPGADHPCFSVFGQAVHASTAQEAIDFFNSEVESLGAVASMNFLSQEFCLEYDREVCELMRDAVPGLMN